MTTIPAVVIGIDVSTTAVKAIAWTRDGRHLAEARRALTTHRPGPQRYEQDPEDWWRGLCATVREVAAAKPGDIAALAIAHQRETIVATDGDGKALRPALLWLDARANDDVAALTAHLPADRLRAITGKSPNYGPAVYKLAWLRRREPDVHTGAARFCDVQAFLAWRLTGTCRTSWPSADPLGLFDIGRRVWSPEIAALVGVAPSRLPEAVAPGRELGRLTNAAARATGLSPGTPLIAGGGDGQAAGLGVGALGPERGYLNLGSAVVVGLHSAGHPTGPGWRTLSDCTGSGYYLESSLRSGALLSDWYLRRLCGIDPESEPERLARLEAAAARLRPGSDGLLLLPYWEGVMNPYWAEDASGCILGLRTHHDRAHVYRAVIEGVAMEQALFLKSASAARGAGVRELAATGGLANSDLWCRIGADVLGVDVVRLATAEATSLGAAMCAAAGAGLHTSIEMAAAAMAGADGMRFRPDPGAAARYRQILRVYRDLFPQLQSLLGRIAGLA